MIPKSYNQVQQLGIIHQCRQVGAIATGKAVARLDKLFRAHTAFVFSALAKQAYEHGERARTLRRDRNVLQRRVSIEAGHSHRVTDAGAAWIASLRRGAEVLEVNGDPREADARDILAAADDLGRTHRSTWDVVHEIVAGLRDAGFTPADFGLAPTAFDDAAAHLDRFGVETDDQHRVTGDRENATIDLHEALAAAYKVLRLIEICVDQIEAAGKAVPGLHFGILRAAFFRARPSDAQNTPPADLDDQPLPLRPEPEGDGDDALPPVEPVGS